MVGVGRVAIRVAHLVAFVRFMAGGPGMHWGHCLALVYIGGMRVRGHIPAVQSVFGRFLGE
jgi:hypothetical protein